MKKNLIFFAIFFCVNVYSQTDTEFWFAAPRLTPNHNNHDIEINIITFDQPSIVTISQPASPNSSFNRTITIPAASSYTLPLGSSSSPLVNVETVFGAVRNTGFLITSDNPVQAYYASTTNNSEVYSLKGRNALGIDFIVPTQTDRGNSTGGYSGGKNSVEIVASQDGTVVEITPSQNCEGHPKNITFTITLNRGQAYAISASGASAAEHLFNTRIRSNKPIAVNYTDDSVAGPGVDLLGDQIIPISQAGTNYVIVANYKKAVGSQLTEKAYVFPTEDNTTVYVNGAQQTIINLGDSWQYNLIANNKDAIQLTSDKPILVLHVTSYDNELGCAVLPALDCTGSKEISYKPAFGTPNFGIITKKEFIDGFTVNGISYLLPPSVFQPVNNDSIWWFTIRPMSVSNLIRIKNSKGYFHAGVFDVAGNTCSLGWFSNFNAISLSSVTDKLYYRVGETINLSLEDDTDLIGVHWVGSNNFSSSDFKPEIENCTLDDAGMYIVTASHLDGCYIEPDTFFVHVFPEIQINQHEICYGNNITLTAPGSEPFLWNTGETTRSVTVNPAVSSDYWVKNMQAGYDNIQLFELTDYFHVEVIDSLNPKISGESFICQGGATLNVLADYGTYLWSTGESTKSITVSEAGNYWVRVIDGDCRGTGYFTVEPAPKIVLNIEEHPSICEGDITLSLPYQITSGEIGKYDIIFDEKAKQAGFVDQINSQLINSEIIVNLPSVAKPDIYNAQLIVYEKECGESEMFGIELMVKYDAKILEQRWDDIVGVLNSSFNGNYTFTDYQWYKNGEILQGATKSYFYESGGFSNNDRYTVLLTRLEDNISVFTCDFSPRLSNQGNIISTVVESSDIISVKNYDQSGVAYIWSLTGNLEFKCKINAGDNQIPTPHTKGLYILQLPDGTKYKIVVK